MADRARKLAAAKKKLKAYQEHHGNVEDVATIPAPAPLEQPIPTPSPQPTPASQEDIGGVLTDLAPALDQEPKSVDVDVIEMLISEKGQLITELAHFKNLSKQRELELEEVQVKYNLTVKKLEELESTFIQEQRVKDELRDLNERLTRETSQMKIKISEHSDYIEELKNCLVAEKQKIIDLESKKQENDLEEFRASHVSESRDDSRIESLMQTKFMYEQQIRDLQAMVQQLTQDREQSNQQYQNYASHLNQEIASLNEKNGELAEQVSKLEAREKGLVDHVSGLEKQIQQNLKQQQQQVENKEEENKKYVEEISELKSQVEAMNEEKMMYQLKIKSQEDKLEELLKERSTPKEEIVERVYSPEEDKKLLEKMESDKIAASRALIQNASLKQQLDELQMKFIELTNDKVELITRLDSEMFSNKDIKQNYQQLKDDIESLTEKLHYKDEEMIRLSHENNDLKLENMELKHGKKVESKDHCGGDSSEDHHKHDHQHHHDDHEHHHDDNECDHHHEEKEEEQETSSHHAPTEEHNHDHGECDHKPHSQEQKVDVPQASPSHSTPKLPPEAAMQKLEVRFTKLMSEVADLTDDKQRLEHLVLQLQGETETIGEYISLYQTQRRVLKQRDYERNNYLQKIESERQELLRKMASLNKLLAGLGIEVPLEAKEESVIEPEPVVVNGYEDKQQVLQKIQSIIHEMQEKSIIKDDLTKCGSGGSIAIDHCSFCSGNLETV